MFPLHIKCQAAVYFMKPSYLVSDTHSTNILLKATTMLLHYKLHNISWHKTNKQTAF